MSQQYVGHISGVGYAVPIPVSTEEFLKKDRMYRTVDGQSEELIQMSKNFILASGIQHRHFCHQMWLPEGKTVEDYPDAIGVPKEDIFKAHDYNPPLYLREGVFFETNVAMAVAAAQRALDNWGGDKSLISHIVTTCTSGWSEPGIAVSVINSCGLRRNVCKQELNFNGCFCGASCLRLANDLIRAGGTGVMVVAVESPSSQMQRYLTAPEMVVAQSLFADGAAAIVVTREGKWKYIETGCYVIEDSTHLLGLRPGYKAEQTGYQMTLHRNVASTLQGFFDAGNGKPILDHMWEVIGHSNTETPGMVIHPGGPKILEAMKKVFVKRGTHDKCLDASFDMFNNFGNLGCAAVPLILARRLLADDIKEDKLITME
jgi:predicted naringenin-chalcone synthase